MKIRILTRCTRPQHLLKVKESLIFPPPEMEVTWDVIFDISVVKNIESTILAELSKECPLNLKINTLFLPGVPGDFGHELLNMRMDAAENDEWICILDDDNELHPNFYRRVYEEHGKGEILIFSQEVGGRDFTGLQIREALPENMKLRGVDMAQFLAKKESLGKHRLIPMTYVADGLFLENLYSQVPEKFHFIPEVLCNYNSLQQATGKSWTLPRVLVVGKERGELKSFKAFEFESDELNVNVTSSEKVFESISTFDPDCILTTGEGEGKSYYDFPQLCGMPSDFRSRWIHPSNEEDSMIGEMAYSCSMNFILGKPYRDLVSVVTPVYNTGEKLRRTYSSVASQTHTNWEWVIVNDSTDSITLSIAEEIAKKDPRVKIYDFKGKTKGIIGEAKYRGCALSRGDYLFELDHDDIIHPEALELMMKGFRDHPDAGFVYSDCAEITENWESLTYGPGFSFGYGSYRVENHFGIDFQVANTANINPLTIRHIVGVPNHFRAWRRDLYFEIGGHNRRLSIADDYELLVRTFLKTKFVKVPYCCYFQFYHGSNSQDASRADIQRRVRTISNYYNEAIKARFEELGKEDWAYPWGTRSQPRFGEEENFVNYILEL